MKRPAPPPEVKRRIERARRTQDQEKAFRQIIRQIPKGKVATYGQVAAAAGYPLHHRQVAQLLRAGGHGLPWQRVLGSGGEIKLRGHMALDQRLRLEMEGVRFRGKRVDMEACQFVFRPWELEERNW
jgi:methylated-DNA-protein-cysteine methyltransferase-like protein